MEVIILLVVVVLTMWGLGKLADHFCERNFVFWLIFYLAGGALAIMVLGVARGAGGP